MFSSLFVDELGENISVPQTDSENHPHLNNVHASLGLASNPRKRILTGGAEKCVFKHSPYTQHIYSGFMSLLKSDPAFVQANFQNNPEAFWQLQQ